MPLLRLAIPISARTFEWYRILKEYAWLQNSCEGSLKIEKSSNCLRKVRQRRNVDETS